MERLILSIELIISLASNGARSGDLKEKRLSGACPGLALAPRKVT
jgi:hypothetical protein